MDILKLLKSLEELLYEVVTWLLFYPRTLWRATTSPLALGRDTLLEFDKPVQEQYLATISPPLFLMLSVLFAHVIELAAGDTVVSKSLLESRVFESDTNLLIFRSVLFALFPLLMATALLRRAGTTADRNTLRRPFFVQCLFTAPIAVFTAIGTVLMHRSEPLPKEVGHGMWLATIAWYLLVETRWFRTSLGIGTIRAFAIVLVQFVLAVALTIAIALAIAGVPDIPAGD